MVLLICMEKRETENKSRREAAARRSECPPRHHQPAFTTAPSFCPALINPLQRVKHCVRSAGERTPRAQHAGLCGSFGRVPPTHPQSCRVHSICALHAPLSTVTCSQGCGAAIIWTLCCPLQEEQRTSSSAHCGCSISW